MTWKKKRPAAVLVSIESVRLRKFTPRACSSDTRVIRLGTLRPSRSRTIKEPEYRPSTMTDTTTSRRSAKLYCNGKKSYFLYVNQTPRPIVLMGKYLYIVFTPTPITSATCCRVAPFSSIRRRPICEYTCSLSEASLSR